MCSVSYKLVFSSVLQKTWSMLVHAKYLIISFFFFIAALQLAAWLPEQCPRLYPVTKHYGILVLISALSSVSSILRLKNIHKHLKEILTTSIKPGKSAL